jgi:hypothetical protein
VFREVNERIAKLDGDRRVSGPISLCASAAAAAAASSGSISRADYEDVRRFPIRFLVRPGHVAHDGERVIRQSGRYVVIEKTGRHAIDSSRDPTRPAPSRVESKARSDERPYLADAGGIGSPMGDAWNCACGERYRVEMVGGGLRFWPRKTANRISVDGYCRQGLPGGSRCIRCETVLSLSRRPDGDLAGDLALDAGKLAVRRDTRAPLEPDAPRGGTAV